MREDNERYGDRYPGSAPLPVPDIEGEGARAWRIDVSEQVTGYVGAWLVRCDGPHAFWNHWLIAVVHLRPIEGAAPAILAAPDASHELVALALNPEHALPRPGADGPQRFRFLEPPDVAVQFTVANDALAAGVLDAAVKQSCDGVLPPDSDFRRLWASAIPLIASRATEA